MPRKYQAIWEQTIRRCLKGDARPIRIHVRKCDDLLAARVRKAIWKEKDLDRTHRLTHGIKIIYIPDQRIDKFPNELVGVFEVSAFPRDWEKRI